MALSGLSDYLYENYDRSIFDTAFQTQAVYTFHLHPQRVISARVKAVQRYDVIMEIVGNTVETIPKLNIKYGYEEDLSSAVEQKITVDPKVRKKQLSAIPAPAQRHHIKNKSLYPLMMDRTVLFFTLLEGEIIRGIVAGFSKYDITLHIKGGIPVTILRHAVYDVRDKKDRCYLKQFQQQARDWKNSAYYAIR